MTSGTAVPERRTSIPSVELPIYRVSGAIRVDATIGKKVLTMTPDIWRMLFFIALGVILRLIWDRRC